MQDKSRRKSAREANQMINPALKPDQGSKKLGKEIAPPRRDFHRILSHMENYFRKEDPSYPREVSAGHMAVVKKLFEYALRDNHTTETQVCPECGEKIEVQVIDARNEKNSVEALVRLADSMFPKLGSVTHEVNVYNTIINLGQGIAKIVLSYVESEKRIECMSAINLLITQAQSAGNNAASQIPYSPGA